MMKTKKMRMLALLLAALMVFVLAGCEVSTSSSSTTTVTTSKTDENGNTTTTTTTTEIGGSVGTDGVSTTNQTTTETTTTSADEEDEDAGGMDGSTLRDHLASLYNVGAEGTNEDGDTFYYLFNDQDGHDEALLVIVSADREQYTGWEGTAITEDDHVLLSGEGHDVPFSFEDTDGGFIMTFLNDGDVATMAFDDIDNVIDDIVAARMEFAG